MAGFHIVKALVAFAVLLLVAAACVSTSSNVDQSAATTTPSTPSTVGAPAASVPTTRAVPAAPAAPAEPAAAATVEPLATASPAVAPTPQTAEVAPGVRTGAGVLIDQDLVPLHGRRVGLIAHRASMVDGRPVAAWIDDHPLVDLTALFAPEHGLYGQADAGISVSDITDPSTGAPVYSLYGTDRAPTAAALADIDVLVYDLQDVGVRFYTYTSTLGLAMQAAALADVEFTVLDRPDPIGGDELQGPALTPGLESFIGMYNVPSAYGLTAGELAILIREQGWVPGVSDLELTVVPMQNWQRTMRWTDTDLAWIPPSPNLPTADSALVYPGTVLFEATSISEGRGTDEPFTLIGGHWIDAPALANELNSRALAGVSFEAAGFVPRSIPGAAESPRFLGQELFGVRVQITDTSTVAGVEVGLSILDAVLRQAERSGLDTTSIIDRPEVFDRLAGNSSVRSDLIAGVAVDEILESFAADHVAFAELAAGVRLYD